MTHAFDIKVLGSCLIANRLFGEPFAQAKEPFLIFELVGAGFSCVLLQFPSDHICSALVNLDRCVSMSSVCIGLASGLSGLFVWV